VPPASNERVRRGTHPTRGRHQQHTAHDRRPPRGRTKCASNRDVPTRTATRRVDPPGERPHVVLRQSEPSELIATQVLPRDRALGAMPSTHEPPSAGTTERAVAVIDEQHVTQTSEGFTRSVPHP
jgi:hypothetical protein